MSRHYKHVFFDLDHTLWDFEKNSSEVLAQLYDDHNLMELGTFTKEDFSAQFRMINLQLWDSYNARSIDRSYLRRVRFNLVFAALGMKEAQVPKDIAADYMQRCPSMTHTFPFAQEVLSYLKNEKKYILHIITNGFEDVQHLKLNSANLSPYFKEVITADAAGFQKPDKAIFGYALSKVDCSQKECIMIGDSLEADIIGAKNAGIDQIFFNPSHVSHKETITYEICCLSELFDIL